MADLTASRVGVCQKSVAMGTGLVSVTQFLALANICELENWEKLGNAKVRHRSTNNMFQQDTNYQKSKQICSAAANRIKYFSLLLSIVRQLRICYFQLKMKVNGIFQDWPQPIYCTQKVPKKPKEKTYSYKLLQPSNSISTSSFCQHPSKTSMEVREQQDQESIKKKQEQQRNPVNEGEQNESHLNWSIVSFSPTKYNCKVDRDVSSEMDGIYLYPTPISKQDPVVTNDFLLAPVHCENQSIPLLLRDFNRLNSLYPNVNHPKFDVKIEAKNIKNLHDMIQKALTFLYGLALRLRNKKDCLALFTDQYIRSLTVTEFISSQWESKTYEKERILLKTNNYQEKEFKDIDQLVQQIDGVLKLLYANSSKASRVLKSQQRKLWEYSYKQARKSLWEIEEKTMEIIGGIYLQILQNQYPDFYYDYLHILQGKSPTNPLSIKHRLLKLIEMREPLTLSAVGRQVRRLLGDM